MFSKNLIDFFKRHNLYDEEMFNYIADHAYPVDYYYDEEQRVGIGFGSHKENNIIDRFSVTFPYQVDHKTMLIAIHEITHAIVAYKHLYKEENDSLMEEALPFLYEKLYINEVNNPRLDEYGKFLDDFESPENADYYRIECYRFALWARDYLINEYDKNFDNMEELTKKLVINYQNGKK